MEPQTVKAVEGIIALCIQLGVPLLVLVCAWLSNRHVQRSRDRELTAKEEYFRTRIRQNNLKRFPAGSSSPVLVSGCAVIANNYFVSFASSFKHLLGGEMKGYTQLCSAARRLALVRMLEEAERAGANAVYNIRFETATIVSANNKQQSGGVELIAYGTAVKEPEA